MRTFTMAFVFTVLTHGLIQAQEAKNSTTMNSDLKTYVIEREIPGAGKLTAEELKNISQASCQVLSEMGPTIQWQHSYVTGDKVYCVYRAQNRQLVEEHARKGGFPANAINEVAGMIGPETGKN